MSDSNAIRERGISMKLEEQEDKNGGTVGGGAPRMDGGTQISEKLKIENERKPRINEEVKSVLLFAATSVVAGYASFVLGGVSKSAPISGTSLFLALGAMILILLASVASVKKIVGKKDMQWIMGNGGAIYLFLWFVSWIIFYNVL